MLRRLLIPALILIGASSASWAATGDCNRACLKTMLDQYLTAVMKHDPAAVPLSAGFRQTDNAVVVRQGTGVWKTVTALGKVQRRYLDATTGQAAYFGTVQEGDAPAIVGVRVKVENRKVTEAEWTIARKGDVGFNGPGQSGGNFFEPDALAEHAPPERTVPRDQRLTRDEMVGITTSYFDGITTHDGSVILAHPGCSRTENGNTVTGRPLAAGAQQANGSPTSDCTSGLATISISNVSGRRFPVVDEEAGVVLGMAVFQRKQNAAQRRNVFNEFFFIEGGKIRNIYAAMFYPAPDAPAPNWEPYDGNWPLPATFGPGK